MYNLIFCTNNNLPLKYLIAHDSNNVKFYLIRVLTYISNNLQWTNCLKSMYLCRIFFFLILLFTLKLKTVKVKIV